MNHPQSDGTIDFESYSLQQLEELQYSIDRDRFPENYKRLISALEQRRSVSQMQPELGPGVAGRYTPRGGWLGWLQAMRGRQAVYGAGSIDVRDGEAILRGWRRTWLGMPEQCEIEVSSEAIHNVTADGNRIRFDILCRFRRRRSVAFETKLGEDARRLKAQLPGKQTPGFGKRWEELNEFNRRTRLIAPHIWATPSLIIANLAVFVAMVLASWPPQTFQLPLLLNWGANFGPLTVNGQWWRLLTALFVHISLMHVAVNMWVLRNIGRLTERLYGSALMLGLYVATGIIASLTSIVWNPARASAGASGAIFGLFGVYLACLANPASRIPLSVVKPYWISTLIFVLFNLISGALQNSVDNAAHIGGLASGLLLGWIVARPLTGPIGQATPLSRILAAVAVWAVLAAGAIWQIRGPGSELTYTEQYLRSHAWFFDGQSRNIVQWQQLANQSAAGTLSNAELGRRFELQILPFWQTADERLQKENKSLQGPSRPYALLVQNFVHLRYEWAKAIIDGTAYGKSSRLADATRLAKETDAAQARTTWAELRESMDHRPRALANAPAFVRLRSLFRFTHARCITSLQPYGPPVAPTDARTDGPAARQSAGCRAQQLFLEGDYEALDRTLQAGARNLDDLPDGGSSFSGLVGGLDDLFEYGGLDVQQSLGRLSDWRRTVQGSIYPDLIEAIMYQSWAWSARGNGGAPEVSAQSWALFAYRSVLADADVQEVAGRSAESPLWYTLALDVGLDRSSSAEQLRGIFDAGIAKFPQYTPLYNRMLRILMPRWLGSYAKVDQFIADQVAKAGPHGPALYAHLYWIYGTLEQDSVNIFTDAMARWPEMKAGFDALVQEHPRSDVILNAYARMACTAKDWDSYAALRADARKRPSATAWTAKVTEAACDAQLVNHYIDAGNALMDSGHLDTAIMKFDHALELDPRADFALADRGMAFFWREDYISARRDIEAAFAINPRNAVVFRGRAMLAYQARRFGEAIADFDKSLEYDPGNTFAIRRRAMVVAAQQQSRTAH